jgi:hypothetical protein
MRRETFHVDMHGAFHSSFLSPHNPSDTPPSAMVSTRRRQAEEEPEQHVAAAAASQSDSDDSGVTYIRLQGPSQA